MTKFAPYENEADVVEIIGINLLPALSDADKERVLALPEIREKPSRSHNRNRH